MRMGMTQMMIQWMKMQHYSQCSRILGVMVLRKLSRMLTRMTIILNDVSKILKLILK